jgi:hypothetical protein
VCDQIYENNSHNQRWKHKYFLGIFAEDRNQTMVNYGKNVINCCEVAFRQVHFGISHRKLAAIRNHIIIDVRPSD